MRKFIYTPDDEISIDKPNAVRQLCSWLRSHEQGIPELVKNSAEAYLRNHAMADDRIIVIILNDASGSSSASISCLDFVGMTSQHIKDFFRRWADPMAHAQDSGIFSGEGGHGQGGKCYMTQMFEDYATINTVNSGKGNHYGVKGGQVDFGFVPDRDSGYDFLVEDSETYLDNLLKPLKCSVEKLPRIAKSALLNTQGFTLVSGYGPRGFSKRIQGKSLINSLRQHPEMLYSLDFCKVYVIWNGAVRNAKRPLVLPKIGPLKGGEHHREIEIPSKLVDIQTGQKISTTQEGKLHRGKLVLHTSDKSMKWKLKGRHTIRFLAGKHGRVGYIDVPELDVRSTFRDHIYGECKLEALIDYKRSSRKELAESPLTRALIYFISEQVESYAQEFEVRQKKKYSKEDKNRVTKMVEKLNEWKNRFLTELISGLWGEGTGDGTQTTGDGLSIGEISRIEIRLTHGKAGLGVTFQPILNFYDEHGMKVRPVPVNIYSSDNNIVMPLGETNVLETFSYGTVEIWAESKDDRLLSNTTSLDVVHIKKIAIEPDTIEIPLGSRRRLSAICKMDDGDTHDDVLVYWDEGNPSIARVASSGLIFGVAPGETEVIAWDNNCEPSTPAQIKVLETEGAAGKGQKKGTGFPLVLVSGEGFDVDPDTNEYKFFHSDEGPICQEIDDVQRNIWWINTAAPLAEILLDKELGYGSDSEEFRIYILDRIIDAIVQMVLTQRPEEGEEMAASQWIQDWMYQVSEIQMNAVVELEEFLKSGDFSF
ncbi:MAG: hypothetical protein H8D67_20365 [Deltaproteobacteria bacterium]|nr:hypothetical protein [Deltaproteobacteria bacterium]